MWEEMAHDALAGFDQRVWAKCTDDASWNHALETYIILLTMSLRLI